MDKSSVTGVADAGVPRRLTAREPDVRGTCSSAHSVVDAFRHEYNTDRPHQSLNMAFPADRFTPRTDDVASLRPPATLPPTPPARHLSPAVSEAPLLPVDRPDSLRTGEPGTAIEVDRTVNAVGAVGLAGRQHPVGYHIAGRRVTVRLDQSLLQLVEGDFLLRSLPNPLTPAELARIRDARPAGPPPQPPADLQRVERRISSRGTLAVTGQRIQVGMVHAGRTVTVEAGDTTWRIYQGGELLAEVARSTSKNVARFKVRKPEPSRRRIASADRAGQVP